MQTIMKKKQMLDELFETSDDILVNSILNFNLIINLSHERTMMPYFENVDIRNVFSTYTHFFNPNVEIGTSKNIKEQKTIKAIKDLPAGAVIFVHTGEIINSHTRTSIQIGDNKHIEPGPYGMYTNHSCEPNGVIRTKANEFSDTATIALIASIKVKKGEEVTFDYATTESFVTPDAMISKCLCGSEKCRGKIMGFNDISKSERQFLFDSGLLADHLVIQYRKPVL